jgi:glycosyltransferase involved in cell wall biosynthesis
LVKIGVDTFTSDGGVSGVGVYLKEILRRVSPSGDRFELFGWDFDKFAFKETAPGLDFISQCRFNGKTANAFWHLLKYPSFAKKQNYNACFFPAAHRRLPRSSPCPSIGTVHDMAAFWGTRRTREHLGAVLRVVYPSSLRRLDRIIAVSEFVKSELIDLARVKANRIEVIPNGIDHSAFYPRPRNDDETVLIQPFSFRRPYVLYVSRLDHPIKNHILLIKAFEIFKERTRYPHRLVLAGGDSHGADLIKEEAQKSPCAKDIFFTGHFPPESLPELYAGADFVAIPSLYEGFGQGVLEAMASGVPLVCARAASLPETAEHAALYFDPKDPEDMADRMVTLTGDRDIYQTCRNKGLERAATYSWETCAEATLKMIQQTAGK